MPRRELKEKNIRKLTRMGREVSSLGLTIPKELADELGWRERQKVVVSEANESSLKEVLVDKYDE